MWRVECVCGVVRLTKFILYMSLHCLRETNESFKGFSFFFMLLIHRAIVYLNHLGKCLITTLSDSLSLSHPPTNFLSLFLFHPHPPLSFYIFVSYLFYYSLNFLYLSIFRFLFLPTTLDFLSGLVSLFTLSMFLFPFLSVNISLNFFF